MTVYFGQEVNRERTLDSARPAAANAAVLTMVRVLVDSLAASRA